MDHTRGIQLLCKLVIKEHAEAHNKLAKEPTHAKLLKQQAHGRHTSMSSMVHTRVIKQAKGTPIQASDQV